MKYDLKNGQTPDAILFWIIDLVNKKYKDAQIFCDVGDEDWHYKEPVSIGLDKKMYERIYSFVDFDIFMKCANGDSITYVRPYCKVLDVNGTEEFINEVMSLDAPKQYMPSFFKEGALREGKFALGEPFYKMNEMERIHYFLNVAKKIDATMLMSTKENNYRMMEVTFDNIPTECKEILDVVIKKDADTWILFHLNTGIIYTNCFSLTYIMDVILKDILDDEDEEEDYDDDDNSGLN